MAQPLDLDFANMLAPQLGGRGIDPDSLDRAADDFKEVHRAFRARADAGELGFLELPSQTETVEQIRRIADALAGVNEVVVVLGIGGSALGTIAMRDALLPPFWNELDDEARDYFPRLYVLDNVDPSTVGPLLDRLPLGRTLFDVVSKSGTTAETMSQFLIVRDRLVAALGDDGYRSQLLFTTDPENGVLRRLSKEEGITALPVPPNVGGRFSVLSAVGLLPAAMVGIDIDGLLGGARDMIRRCDSGELLENPAGLFAVLQHAAATEKDAPVQVMMAYSDRLYGAADWFRQLWAESLGKRQDRQGRDVFRGPTPVKALGATDQHSQVQLYMEGPFDKTITLLSVEDLGDDVAIPEGQYADIDALAYLGGKSLGRLLHAERRATAAALARHGRMNMTLTLPDVSAHSLGQLFMLLEIATAYSGELYDVNPLDQPGVELGKRLTYGLMGRKGYASEEGESEAGASEGDGA